MIVVRNRTKVVPSNPLKADPTRTATLRRIFERDLRVRFAKLKGKIRALIIDEDAFGIQRRSVGAVPPSKIGTNVPRLARNISASNADNGFNFGMGITSLNQGELVDGHSGDSGRSDDWVYSRQLVLPDVRRTVVNTRFAFLTTPEQVAQFQTWLETQIQADILTTTAARAENAYWQKYVEEGYRKGAGRAFDDVRKPALESNLDFFNGTKAQFLQQSFGRPVAVEKVKLLAGRVFTELNGITNVMSQQITRELTDGLVQGDNVHVIARRINDRVDKIGRTRSTILARTEIVRAHAEGQLDSLEELGVKEVGVAVEWSTAGDDRVCPLCAPLEGVVMKIKEARGSIPRHPQCRCAFVPANVGESTEGQKRRKSDITKAIERSLRAERPRRSKRSVAAQRRLSRWPGAGKTIDKKRPKSVI